MFGGGRLWATINWYTTEFHTADWLGTRRIDTDNCGTAIYGHKSLPFGDGLQTVTLNASCTGGNTPDAERHFTGKERDAESTLDYFGARYYTSSMGRWLSPDWTGVPMPVPFADFRSPASLNLYIYVQNDPTFKSDPDGHQENAFWCFRGLASFCPQPSAPPTPDPAGTRLGPSDSGHAEADANPAVLKEIGASGTEKGGTIFYKLSTRPGAKQYMIVQAETNTKRSGTGPAEFGPGTSVQRKTPGFNLNEFADSISPGPAGGKGDPNSIQTFYMVPVDEQDNVTGLPMPVNVVDRSEHVFYKLGVYFNQTDGRAYVNGRVVDSPTLEPPR